MTEATGGLGALKLTPLFMAKEAWRGECLHSLVVTVRCGGWAEVVALLAREQNLVMEGLKRIRAQMPMSVLGINFDSDRAIMNETLAGCCRAEGIAFT